MTSRHHINAAIMRCHQHLLALGLPCATGGNGQTAYRTLLDVASDSSSSLDEIASAIDRVLVEDVPGESDSIAGELRNARALCRAAARLRSR